MSGPLLDVNLQWTPPGSSLTLDVAFQLDAQAAILFGSSGAGKSSILRLIAGLERPRSGHVRLNGDTLFESSRHINEPLRRRRIGLIFQDDLLFPHLSVAANIQYGLKTWPRVEREKRTAEVADLCGVGHLMGRDPATLSGGERQRVGLARALAPRPRLLLCDEPVSALDLAARDLLIDRISAVQRAEGIPMLYVTHSPVESVTLGSWLFRIDAGQIVDQGPPLDVLARGGKVELTGVDNRFTAVVESHDEHGRESTLHLNGGTRLVVPKQNTPSGQPVIVRIRADDILLARGMIEGLSARNVLPGVVDRVIVHGAEAEVLVKTGEIRWIVSVVTPALETLGLCAGVSVHMIVKARSCHVTAAASQEI